jgi:hypothetical protein
MYLYLVKLSDSDTGECFYKVGVSTLGAGERFAFGKTAVKDSNLSLGNKLEKMLSGQKYLSDTPYDVCVIHEVRYKYEGDALMAERSLLEKVASSKYTPRKKMSGHTECFICDDLKPMREYMDADSTATNSEAPDELKYKFCAIGVRIGDPIARHVEIKRRVRERFGDSDS